MNEFHILRALDIADAAGLADFHVVAAAARAFDGYAPFNEQALLDLQSGSRTAYLVQATTEGEGAVSATEVPSGANTVVVGAALGGRGEVDLVISPTQRRRGYGRAAAHELIKSEPEGLTAWAHGDHPGARALASELRFVAARTLLEMRKPLEGEAADTSASAASALAPGESISAFRVGIDNAEWVQLNALVFVAHPEQGAITEADLSARAAESWFDKDAFLILRDGSGAMIGYNWLKIDGAIGEIYVIGVHADAAGRGLGRALMQAGIAHLIGAGCTTAALYVEADSLGPVHLYRSLGFVDHTVDVQYQRLTN